MSDYHHLGAVARKVGFTEEVDETSLALLSHRIHRYEFELIGWEKKAKENVDKWGLQDLGTLLLATQEELGEVAEAAQPHLETKNVRLNHALCNTVDVGLGVQQIHESTYEDENGKPIENPPTFDFSVSRNVEDISTMNEADSRSEILDEIEDEVQDTAALLIQIQAAIERERE